MATETTMLHVRVDEKLKGEAAEALAGVGLSISEAVRILLTRVVTEKGLPPGLTTDPVSYDTWFKSKVLEAMEDSRPRTSHKRVMDDAKQLIARKQRRQD